MLLPEPDDARTAFGAVLGAFGGIERLDDLSQRILVDLAIAVYGIDLVADPVAPLSAAEVRAGTASDALRHQIVHLLVVLEFAAHPLPEDLARDIADYAHALGISSTLVRDARELARGHLAVVYADLQRHSWYAQETVAESLHGKLAELIDSKLAYIGIAADKKIATRWRSLGDMPPGSWGRGVADFYERHGFPFPGERHGIYEIGAKHDFVHVLTDYDATPEGELDVFAFIGACMPDQRGLVLLAVTLGIFQNGAIHHVMGKRVKIARTDTLADPGAVARWVDAFRRGRECPVDVLGGVDHFALAPLPLSDVRAQLGVPPRLASDTPGGGSASA